MTSPRLWLMIVFTALVVGCGRQADEGGDAAAPPPPAGQKMEDERLLVDEYLTNWDQFAQGNNQLGPYLRENEAAFESALATLCRSGDPMAPARLVFYPVVQVGGSISVDSELGQAARVVVGDDCAITTMEDGREVLFSADLYAWWEEHRHEFDRFEVFDGWLSRDFARDTVLPMYQRLQQQSNSDTSSGDP